MQGKRERNDASDLCRSDMNIVRRRAHLEEMPITDDQLNHRSRKTLLLLSPGDLQLQYYSILAVKTSTLFGCDKKRWAGWAGWIPVR